MSGNLFLLLFFAAAVLAAGVYLWWYFRWTARRAESLLAEWAEANGYTIVSKRSANNGNGPMSTRQGPKYVCYRVEVESASGERQAGIGTLGSAKMGLLERELAVDWDG